MEKEFISEHFNTEHYIRTGVFAVLPFISLGVFLPIGEVRYVFLFALAFIPFFIGEWVYYSIIRKELKEDKHKTATMHLAKVVVFKIHNKDAGYEFQGIIDGKVKVLRYYTLDKNKIKKCNKILEYRYLDLEYYPITKVVKNYHTREKK